MNLFALLGAAKEPTVTRVPLSRQLQQTIGVLFDQQEVTLLERGLEEVAYSPSHRPDDAEVAYIDRFALPAAVVEALKNPLDRPVLKLGPDERSGLKGFFGRANGSADAVRFQIFEKRQFLDPGGLSLVLSRGTFQRLSDPGLTLDGKLVAVCRGSRLYFRSFALARRVLDLAEYYREATDDDMRKFTAGPAVRVEDDAAWRQNADEWVRRRVALIQDAGVLGKVPVRKIASEAQRFGVMVQVKQNKIVLPSDKKELKQLLRFLDENYYTSSLTGVKFVANSKRPV